MKILRKICSAVLCAAVAVFMVCSLAEGKEKAGALSAEDFVPADTVAVSDIIEGLTARSAVVTEMTTGTSTTCASGLCPIKSWAVAVVTKRLAAARTASSFLMFVSPKNPVQL